MKKIAAIFILTFFSFSAFGTFNLLKFDINPPQGQCKYFETNPDYCACFSNQAIEDCKKYSPIKKFCTCTGVKEQFKLASVNFICKNDNYEHIPFDECVKDINDFLSKCSC